MWYQFHGYIGINKKFIETSFSSFMLNIKNIILKKDHEA